MIWMGVAGPKDWNALGNRFPTLEQRVTAAIKRMFVAKSHQLGTAARRSGKSSARNIVLGKVAWESENLLREPPMDDESLPCHTFNDHILPN
jgi:hypothetical protein